MTYSVLQNKSKCYNESMELRQLRKSKKLTQLEAAKLCGISLRTYTRYENNCINHDNFKYRSVYEIIYKHNYIDENHGVLTLEEIISISTPLFKKYNVNFAYLFGSYSRNEAHDNSDIDFYISMSSYGLDYFGLIEELRESLHKKIDMLDEHQIENNSELAFEILKDGIKIYDNAKRRLILYEQNNS